jgi:hypothetical protein
MPARSAATDSAVIVFDKVVQIGTATASASGVWLFTTGSLARGANAFVSMAVDVAADVSSISTALNASISTAASVGRSLFLSSTTMPSSIRTKWS